MKILFLGPSDSPIVSSLKKIEEEVDCLSDSLTQEFLNATSYEFLISYGYRHLTRPWALHQFKRRAINLHISYLPWNRGADPNFWAIFEGTPIGVTIHYIDEGLDTGDILIQEEVCFENNDTLKTSYEKLKMAIEALFMSSWPKIKNGELISRTQAGVGSFHKKKDFEPFTYLIQEKGYDTPIQLIAEKGRKLREKT